jgi:hypothetical protein
LGPTRRGCDPDPVAQQAVCSCGLRSEREHPVPPRPARLARDERGLPFGQEYDAWIAALESAEEACWEDWNAEHFQPLLAILRWPQRERSGRSSPTSTPTI